MKNKSNQEQVLLVKKNKRTRIIQIV
jgi:hypothetical protein